MAKDSQQPSIFSLLSSETVKTEFGSLLKICCLCKSELKEGAELFLYGEFQAFCSHRCRQKQISIDTEEQYYRQKQINIDEEKKL